MDFKIDKSDEYLSTLGVPMHLKGYDYLKYALNVYDKKAYPKIMVLYYDIAKKFNSTPSRVERAIRHAISTSFSHMPKNIKINLFGTTLVDDEVPCVSQYITTLSANYRYQIAS